MKVFLIVANVPDQQKIHFDGVFISEERAKQKALEYIKPGHFVSIASFNVVDEHGEIWEPKNG